MKYSTVAMLVGLLWLFVMSASAAESANGWGDEKGVSLVVTRQSDTTTNTAVNVVAQGEKLKLTATAAGLDASAHPDEHLVGVTIYDGSSPISGATLSGMVATVQNYTPTAGEHTFKAKAVFSKTGRANVTKESSSVQVTVVSMTISPASPSHHNWACQYAEKTFQVTTTPANRYDVIKVSVTGGSGAVTTSFSTSTGKAGITFGARAAANNVTVTAYFDGAGSDGVKGTWSGPVYGWVVNSAYNPKWTNSAADNHDDDRYGNDYRVWNSVTDPTASPATFGVEFGFEVYDNSGGDSDNIPQVSTSLKVEYRYFWADVTGAAAPPNTAPSESKYKLTFSGQGTLTLTGSVRSNGSNPVGSMTCSGSISGLEAGDGGPDGQYGIDGSGSALYNSASSSAIEASAGTTANSISLSGSQSSSATGSFSITRTYNVLANSGERTMSGGTATFSHGVTAALSASGTATYAVSDGTGNAHGQVGLDVTVAPHATAE